MIDKSRIKNERMKNQPNQYRNDHVVETIWTFFNLDSRDSLDSECWFSCVGVNQYGFDFKTFKVQKHPKRSTFIWILNIVILLLLVIVLAGIFCYKFFNGNKRTSIDELILSNAKLLSINSSSKVYLVNFNTNKVFSSTNNNKTFNLPMVAKISLKSNDLALLHEINILKSLPKHDNVIRFMGSTSKAYYNSILLIEYCQNGNLLDHLKSRKLMNNPLINGEVEKYSKDIISGINFLHKNSVIHRDLACRNILIDGNGVLKLIDFELSIDLKTRFHSSDNDSLIEDNYFDEQSLNEYEKLPIRWMSPESIFHGDFSCASDIWSFGIVLYEILTMGDLPYKDLETVWECCRFIKSGGTVDFSCFYCLNPNIINVMKLCLNHYSVNRPDSFIVMAYLMDSNQCKE